MVERQFSYRDFSYKSPLVKLKNRRLRNFRALLHRRRRAGRHDVGVSAGTCRRQRFGAGKTLRFLRDFRGDTIHPSTLEVMRELGLFDEFLELPHQKFYELNAQFGEMRLTVADFRYLPSRCGFIALMPQWDFLNFLAEKAARYPSFDFKMEAEVIGLIEESGRVVGVRAKTTKGEYDIRADLVVGANGRNSIVREKAGLRVKEFGAPMDVLWFRLRRSAEDPAVTMGRFDTGRIFIALHRGDYWQCGYVIAKGQFEHMRRQDFENFRAAVVKLAPDARAGVRELRDWDDVKLLTVRRRPFVGMVPAGSLVHWRRRPRHVSGRAVSASISRSKMRLRQPTFSSKRCARDNWRPIICAGSRSAGSCPRA